MAKIQKKEIDCGGIAPFRIQMNYTETDRRDPQNEFNSHVHAECEIYLNLTGDVSFVVENRIYPVSSGNIVISRPYEYHHCVYHSDAPHKHFWILFSADGNEDCFPLFFRRKAGEGNLLTLSRKSEEELILLCHRMIGQEGTAVSQQSGFWRIMELLEQAESRSPDVAQYPADLRAAVDFINAHFCEPISIRDLADASYVSLHTLERHFSDMMGMSPAAYLKKKRLAYAAELLYKGRNVMEACTESGFSDYSGFIATFKRYYGVTPLQYRRRVRRG